MPWTSHLEKFRLFQAPPWPAVPDRSDIARQYRYWRIRVMYSLFIGYAMYYFCRKNISIALPAIAHDLHLSNTKLGILGSALYVTYGVGKFTSGVLGDRVNSRNMMVIGITLSALMNLFFGLSSSLTMLIVFWGLNGWFQSLGAPPCARMLSYWYSPSERGTLWGIWNISLCVGAAGAAVTTGIIIERAGWRAAFFIPAALCLGTAVFLWNRLPDVPRTLGLPSIAEYRKEDEFDASGSKISEDPESVGETLRKRVLNNRNLWLLAVVNMLLYMVRTGIFDWVTKFMVETKGSSLSRASALTSALEILGMVGALVAGTLSDRLDGARRGPTCLFFLLLVPVGLIGFYLNPPGHFVRDAILLSVVGFGIYGPLFLFGVFAADLATRKAVAAAIGFLGVFGYAGAALSGVGTGLLVDRYGWIGGFGFWILASLLSILLTAGLWNVRARRVKP